MVRTSEASRIRYLAEPLRVDADPSRQLSLGAVWSQTIPGSLATRSAWLPAGEDEGVPGDGRFSADVSVHAGTTRNMTPTINRLTDGMMRVCMAVPLLEVVRRRKLYGLFRPHR